MVRERATCRGSMGALGAADPAGSACYPTDTFPLSFPALRAARIARRVPVHHCADMPCALTSSFCCCGVLNEGAWPSVLMLCQQVRCRAREAALCPEFLWPACAARVRRKRIGSMLTLMRPCSCLLRPDRPHPAYVAGGCPVALVVGSSGWGLTHGLHRGVRCVFGGRGCSFRQ